MENIHKFEIRNIWIREMNERERKRDSKQEQPKNHMYVVNVL